MRLKGSRGTRGASTPYPELEQPVINRDSYLRHVLTLGAGTVGAHAITLGVTPLLTRLYTPEDFGVLAICIALIGLLGVGSTLRLEMAIIQAESDAEACMTLGLCGLILLVISGLVGVLVMMASEWLALVMGSEELARLLWLVPIGVFLRGLHQTLNVFLTRRSMIRRIATARTGQAGTAAAAQVVSGFSMPAMAIGLLGGQIIGTLVAVSMMLSGNLREVLASCRHWLQPRMLFGIALRRRAFIQFDAPAAVLNLAAYEAPALILGVFFVEAVVGQFAVAMRIVALPTVLISASLAQIFYQRATISIRKHGNARAITELTLRTLLRVALPLYLLFAIASPPLFPFVLGANWLTAGVYVAIMSPFCFIMLLVAPISQWYLAKGKQRDLFKFQLIYLGTSVAAFLIGGIVGSPLLAVILFAVLGAARYVVMLLQICRAEGIALRRLLVA